MTNTINPQTMPLCLLAAALLTRLPLHLPYPSQDPVATISASMLPKPSPLGVGLPLLPLPGRCMPLILD